MPSKKIIIAMPSEDELLKSFFSWGKNFDWLNVEPHFVHVIRKDYMVNEVSIIELPDQKTVEEIKVILLQFMKNKAQEIVPAEVMERAKFEILLDSSPADRVAKYGLDIGAQTIVVGTRQKKGILGIFTSSFAERLLAVSACDLLVLRPQKT
jgi:nucleotide-binding universal stress UspA family protein